MITDLDVQHELLKVALLSTDNYLSIEEAAQDAGRANSVMMKDFLYHYDSAYRALVSIGILDQHQEYMQKHLNNMWKMSHDDDATLADNPYAETTGMSGEMGESRVNSFLGFHAEKELNESEVTEDLRKWFKEKWVRMDTKGNIKGDCAREAGEGKPKCLPQAKANALSQEERARAARRKRREDPNPEREGKAIFVKTESVTESVETLEEKNVPTSPEKWAQAKAAAKLKFAVYPSAYANGWAAKKYKEMGGGWKSVSEESDSFKSFCDFHDSGIVEEEFTSDGNELYEDWGEVAEQVDGKTLNKPFLTPNGPKKRAVYVKNDSGNVVKVNFGDPHMEIKRDNPERRKSYRARHNCDNPGPKHKANYWSCKFWSTTPVSKL